MVDRLDTASIDYLFSFDYPLFWPDCSTTFIVSYVLIGGIGRVIDWQVRHLGKVLYSRLHLPVQCITSRHLAGHKSGSPFEVRLAGRSARDELSTENAAQRWGRWHLRLRRNLGFLGTANGTQASFTCGAYRFFDNCYDAGCLRRDRTLEISRGVCPHLEEREPAFFSTAQICGTIDKPFGAARQAQRVTQGMASKFSACTEATTSGSHEPLRQLTR